MGQIKIDSQELRTYLRANKITMTELSTYMNRSNSYISRCIQTSVMSAVSYETMCKKLGVDYGTFIANHDDAPETVPSVYRLSLAYSSQKVLVQLMQGENVVIGAWSFIKEPGLTGFLQAVSYASHMMYKFSQQNDLNGEESE